MTSSPKPSPSVSTHWLPSLGNVSIVSAKPSPSESTQPISCSVLVPLVKEQSSTTSKKPSLSSSLSSLASSHPSPSLSVCRLDSKLRLDAEHRSYSTVETTQLASALKPSQTPSSSSSRSSPSSRQPSPSRSVKERDDHPVSPIGHESSASKIESLSSSSSQTSPRLSPSRLA